MKPAKIPAYFYVLTIFSLLLAGCTTGSAQASELDLAQRPIRVAATTGMVGDIAQNVGGDRVSVTALMGPGVDPHLFKASEGDLHLLEKADVIFYNGLHLEAGMERIFNHMVRWKRIEAVTAGIDRSLLTTSTDYANSYDPHIWFDVSLWMQAAEHVRDTLAEMDPAHAAIYEENARVYLEDLAALDDYVREQAERIPAEKRVLITAHDAFGYFGRAYGFEVRGLQGISTAAEAGTADVQALAQMITERQIPAIFIESSLPQRNVEAVQAAVRARGFAVRIGGELYSDAMGTTGTPAGNYIGMVRHNIDTISAALTAPLSGE